MFHAAVFVGILCTQSFFAVASDPFSVINGTLMFTSPVSSHNNNANVDNSGFLVQFNPSPDSSFKTFSMDIGVNRGLVLFEWLNKLPHVSIMGVEANHHMVSKLLYADTGIVALRERFVIIPGAVSTKEGIAKFNRGNVACICGQFCSILIIVFTGAGWEDKSLLPDVGSLFGWTDSGREDVRKKTTDMQQPVRLFALSDVLKHVHPPQPPHFLWDSMKIDVQGADVDAMVSAGDYLKNFICVVGKMLLSIYSYILFY